MTSMNLSSAQVTDILPDLAGAILNDEEMVHEFLEAAFNICHLMQIRYCDPGKYTEPRSLQAPVVQLDVPKYDASFTFSYQPDHAHADRVGVVYTRGVPDTDWTLLQAIHACEGHALKSDIHKREQKTEGQQPLVLRLAGDFALDELRGAAQAIADLDTYITDYIGVVEK